MYERLGFAVQTWYRTMEARGLAAAEPGGAVASAAASRADAMPAHPRRTLQHRPFVRAYRPADLPAMARLDARATGEDRAHLLAAFASPSSTRVVVGADGRPRGFVVRAPWGGGATIAPDLDDALAILASRRFASGPDRHVRCGILLENEAGAAALEAAGWTEAWRAPRLVRGEPLTWAPEAIWGQFNHALG